MSIAIIAYVFPYWALVACACHALVMAAWLQFFEKSPFCSDFLYGVTFSLIMGLVYIFTYIMPVDGKTRYRYALYYSLCFLEDIVCTMIWILCTKPEIRNSTFFIPIVAVSIGPFILGIICMILYYQCLHPKLGNYGKRRTNKVFEVETAETNNVSVF